MSPPPKLYLDENVHKQVASALRIRGYDVMSAHEKENWGLSDSEQLDYAISNERAVFTFDPRDFIQLHELYIEKEQDHFGIIVSDQISLGKTISKLSNLMVERDREELKNALLWL